MEGNQDRRYRLLWRITTPFGTWDENEVRTESEWKKIAPNGGFLVDFDLLGYSFAWVHDKVFDARMIDDVPALFAREDAYGFNPGLTPENMLDMHRMDIRPDAVEALRDACDKYLALMRQPSKRNKVSALEQREVTPERDSNS